MRTEIHTPQTDLLLHTAEAIVPVHQRMAEAAHHLAIGEIGADEVAKLREQIVDGARNLQGLCEQIVRLLPEAVSEAEARVLREAS